MPNGRDADKIGAVLIVGAGIGGMQAALMMAEAGFRAYLLDKAPAIGGLMPLLDRTFPTNTCSLCTICPSQPAYCPFVECDRHPNIELIPYAEVEGLEGEPGRFSVSINRKPRYVDAERCTGCGDCMPVCPVEVPRELGGGLEKRKAIYRPYPQAFPDTYLIDLEHCTKCMECVKVCPTQAVNLNMEQERGRVEVGAVILTPGATLFDAHQKGEFGHGRHENVLSSIQFERMLSLTSPSKGMPVRPSDGRVPRRIAFILCVGSRDIQLGRGYCSSICCMYSIKQAILTRERAPECEVIVFYMDIRTFGKDFERYFERSRTEGGIIYRPSMVSAVKQLQRTKNLITTYVGEDGRLREEEFDLVALSVGLGPLEEAAQLASRLGIELNSYGFCRRSTLLPNQTSRVGIFVGGAFAEPKDIPETVAEVASAAASAARFLGPSRGSLSGEREYPPLRDVSYEEPKIGVFVCRCGTEITDVINVTSVISHVGGLKNVALARGISKACTAEGIEEIGRSIIEKELNRLVVAGCSHRLYEAPLHACLRSAGLSPHLLERVNLLGECVWVHRHNPIAATTKAQALVSMGVAKASLLDPAQRAKEPLIQSGLVIGGGLAGMTASLSLAEQGFQVYLVEKESELGGNLRHIHYLLGDSNPQRYLSDLVAEVERNNLITVYRRATVENISGPVGQYKATIFLAEENKRVYLDHGTIIVATGAHEAQPEEYLYGKHARVITQRELESRLAKGDKDILAAKRVAMIQCVGSRDEEHPYCSRVCCGQAVKNALRIKESSPLCDVFVIYRDIRTYGFMEDYYRRAREAGVLFMRYDPEQKPQVSPEGGMVSVLTRDSALGGELTINADWLVLSTGMIPNDNDALAKLLNVPLNEDGFFLEANPKSPLDFSRAGIYLCGLAHAPKLAAESICQANGAAMRAAIVLGKGYVEGPLAVATVDEELCCGCGLCVEICPYGARELDESVRRIAQVDEILCRGCGLCAAICRNSASQQKAFKAKQVMDMLDAAWG